MKVYIVTEGEYSDYSILGVFSEGQKEAVDRYEQAGADVEEWELDALVNVPPFHKPYEVMMTPDFEVIKEYTRPCNVGQVVGWDGRMFLHKYHHAYIVYLFALDLNHAIKLTSQKVVEHEREKETNP